METVERYAWIRRSSAGGLILAGLAMLVLPGPGLVSIVAGLSMLERDLPVVRRGMGWARRTWARFSPTG
jgi:hypothetical protein